MKNIKIRRFLAVVLAMMLVLSLTACGNSDYKKAGEAMNAGDYAAARELYAKLGDYEDSAEKLTECDYQLALAIDADADPEAAAAAFAALGSYKDSAEKLQQAKDEVLRRLLVGKWSCKSVDMTDILTAAITEALDEDGQAFMEYVDMKDLTLTYELEFTQQGTIVEGVDDAQFQTFLANLSTSFSNAFVAYIEQTMKAEAEANGLTFQQILEFYEVDTTEELITFLFGMEVTEFIDQAMVTPLKGLGEFKENGTFQVKDGAITLCTGTESEEAVYDAAAGKLTLTGVGAPEDQQDMYPMVFTKD